MTRFPNTGYEANKTPIQIICKQPDKQSIPIRNAKTREYFCLKNDYKICKFVYKLLNPAALVMVHPEVKNWIKYARFEERHGYIAHSRKVYERAVEFFGEVHVDENLFVAFAKFEETQKEVSGEHDRPVAALMNSN